MTTHKIERAITPQQISEILQAGFPGCRIKIFKNLFGGEYVRVHKSLSAAANVSVAKDHTIGISGTIPLAAGVYAIPMFGWIMKLVMDTFFAKKIEKEVADFLREKL